MTVSKCVSQDNVHHYLSVCRNPKLRVVPAPSTKLWLETNAIASTSKPLSSPPAQVTSSSPWNPDNFVWRVFGGDLQNTNSAKSKIDTSNVALLTERTPAFIGGISNGQVVAVDVFASATADEKHYYLCTFDKYLPDAVCSSFVGTNLPQGGVYPTNPSSTSGYVLKVSKKTGEVEWRRPVSQYTGVQGDFSRSAPALIDDHLFIATNMTKPQTLDGFAEDYSFLFGPNSSAVRGARPSLIRISKEDPDVFKNVPIGQKADHANDPDNWISCTASPVATYIRAQGRKVPVVVLGTSSSQSFMPWLFVKNGASPSDPQYFLGDNYDFRFTDVGKVLVFDANTMQPIVDFEVAPRAPSVGTQITVDNGFFASSQNYVGIPLVMDVATRWSEFGGVAGIKGNYSYPGTNSFTNRTKIRYILIAGSPAPPPVVGLSVSDETRLTRES
jgi:hypothetical protein